MVTVFPKDSFLQSPKESLQGVGDIVHLVFIFLEHHSPCVLLQGFQETCGLRVLPTLPVYSFRGHTWGAFTMITNSSWTAQ
ncbi:hypothetical protein XELAEV_18003065mg [Xenopus laevis]|uniref:Uncharacterized protein n=1 Tax=Xenopus laevis TaxID=8355 RepID=A0A974GYI7_XENLA|nr:hypothetical protein XELAEV_18003065mg [Xenopus laevis]